MKIKQAKDVLTSHQVELLSWVARGLYHKQIASVMGISKATLKTQLTTIYYKLGAYNAPHAVAIAIKQGWL